MGPTSAHGPPRPIACTGRPHDRPLRQSDMSTARAAHGGFDVGSGVQIAREYANVLAQLGQAGEPGAVPRFDVYDVAAAVTEFDWVEASCGETLQQARERATRVGADLILQADLLDATREPRRGASVYREGQRWVQRSRPLPVAVQDAVAIDPMLAPSVLAVAQSIPRGELFLPARNPAVTAAVITAVLAVQSPPER